MYKTLCLPFRGGKDATSLLVVFIRLNLQQALALVLAAAFP